MEETTVLTPKQQRRMAAQRKRNHNVLLAFVFILLILVFFIINLCVKDKEFSDAENRSLAQKPQFTFSTLADGSYFSGLTAHYADQFFARDGWMSMKLREDTLLGRKESGGVYLCENDQLLSKPEAPNAESLAATVEAIKSFSSENAGLNINMMVIPSAATVLSESLPKNAPVRDQFSDIQELETQLAGSVRFMDAITPLVAHKDEYIYYKTDHHWTTLGAYYTFMATAADMGIFGNAVSYDVYPVTDSFEGTLSSKSGSHKALDTINIYAPTNSNVQYYVSYPDGREICSIYSSNCLQEKDKYTVFFGGNHSIVEIHTTANNDKNLLLFKDSYANSFVEFLIPHYESIIMIDPRYYYDSINSIINNQGITHVLFLYSADILFQDTSLVDVLSSGSEAGSLAEIMNTESFGSIPTEDSTVEPTSSEEPASAEESIVTQE